ncbi:hypothetical protein LXL04_004406 [Taraxacum kok-saghyz]
MPIIVKELHPMKTLVKQHFRPKIYINLGIRAVQHENFQLLKPQKIKLHCCIVGRIPHGFYENEMEGKFSIIYLYSLDISTSPVYINKLFIHLMLERSSLENYYCLKLAQISNCSCKTDDISPTQKVDHEVKVKTSKKRTKKIKEVFQNKRVKKRHIQNGDFLDLFFLKCETWLDYLH